ncbi:uncharacterized protein E0L32_006190 [Thyridium curvatum]|uniref:tRNA pseudouridine(55) synthase n=1 Tax=Thyridium curvatum TaxID=1093900 RepID=A0A507BA26_9PEZI|nr:uncharacterized protein E0L32_006190 [Thyridium curvatum]TPX13460.1 hypothetical protein E0L32_006190 [Thyridium curvatum]
MAKETVLEGIFAINKPIGMSSAQVIRDCQTFFNPSSLFRPLIEQEAAARARESNQNRKRRGKAKRDVRVKMGHGGTLDPLATGVLILGVGRGTKALPEFINCTKTYETIVLFGASTDTYDRVGRILKKRDYENVTRKVVEEALDGFRGKYRQMPPLYSALKMNGKPLYEYAREGKAIPREIETREVEVSELELLEWYEPGEHNHRWPTEEAGAAEQTLADQVWRMEKQQATGKKLSPEEEKSDIEALAAHEDFKKRAEQRQDELVYERPSKRRKHEPKAPPMMSGALGDLPTTSFQNNRPTGKGSNLLPPPPPPNTPPPWAGKGPPAAKIRMTVTSGFYVRSFCHDLGEKVGSAAMMAELARTRQGAFSAGTEDCLEYDDLLQGEKVWGPQVEAMLARWMDPDGKKQESASAAAAAAAAAPSPPSERSSPRRSERQSGPSEGVPGSPKAGDKRKTRPDEEDQAPLSTPKEDDAKSVKSTESEWNGFSDTPASQSKES